VLLLLLLALLVERDAADCRWRERIALTTASVHARFSSGVSALSWKPLPDVTMEKPFLLEEESEKVLCVMEGAREGGRVGSVQCTS